MISRIIRYFILTDFLLLGGYGMISPIFSVFIVEEIAGASLTTIGIATAIYFILKSLLQFPIAKFLDKTDGEKDDFYALVFGLILAGITALLLAMIVSVWQIYALQALQALAFALYVPAWYSIFSRHLDKDKYAFEWALSSGAIGLASGIFGAIGGVLAESFGFRAVFILGSALPFLAVLAVIAVPKLIFPRETKKPEFFKDQEPRDIK